MASVGIFSFEYLFRHKIGKNLNFAINCFLGDIDGQW